MNQPGAMGSVEMSRPHIYRHPSVRIVQVRVISDTSRLRGYLVNPLAQSTGLIAGSRDLPAARLIVFCQGAACSDQSFITTSPNRSDRLSLPRPLEHQSPPLTWDKSPYPRGVSCRMMALIGNPLRTENSMPSQSKTKIALVGGAVAVAFAAGIGGGALLGNTTTPTPVATPTSSVAPTPPATATPAPSTDGAVPSGSNGCIPHMNC